MCILWQFLGWEDPLEKGMATHSSILAWRIKGQRSLVGYSSWDCKELDTTEQLTLSLYGGMKALINKEQRDCTPYFSISFFPPPPSTLAR